MRDDSIYRLEYIQATISSFTIRIAQQTQIKSAKNGGEIKSAKNYCAELLRKSEDIKQ